MRLGTILRSIAFPPVLAVVAIASPLYTVAELQVPLPEGGFAAIPTSISSGGFVAGHFLTGGGYTTNAFIYNPGSGAAQYLTIGGYAFTSSQFVNAGGVAASTYLLYSQSRQAWEYGVARFGGAPASYWSTAENESFTLGGVDDAGDVAASTASGGVSVWLAGGGFTNIGAGIAYTMSPGGIVGYTPAGLPYQYESGVSAELTGRNPVIAIDSHGAVLRGWGMTCAFGSPSGPVAVVGTLGGSSSVCRGLSADGVVVGLDETELLPFVYSGGTMSALNSLLATPGFTVTNPIAMSDNGLILAEGINLSTSQADYLVLSPLSESEVPEPAAAPLCAILLALAVRRVKRASL